VLEPDDGKPSSPVLRGLGASNGARPLNSYTQPEVRFEEDGLYFVEFTGKREPIGFLRGTSFSFHLVSN